MVYYTIVYSLSFVYYSYNIVGVGQWIIIGIIISIDIIYIYVIVKILDDVIQLYVIYYS